MGDLCRVSTTADFKTVSRRVKTEGDSFLTITLPNFQKAFERGLEEGRLTPDALPGFRFRGGLPIFLRGFLELVFNAENGVVLDSPDPQAVYAIRQMAGLCKKVELECSAGRVRAAYAKYVECEQQVMEADQKLRPSHLAEFGRIGRLLFARVFTRVDGEVASFGLQPKHGPGATANGLGGNAKYDCLQWTVRLERVFPSSEYLLPNVRFHQRLDHIDLLEPGSEWPVKVTHVPKTMKTPRIIAEEPSYIMFMQQALWRELKSGLESDRYTRNLLGFSDQTPNRVMAREGSITGDLATLDLSEASDRVSLRLVRVLLANHPHLREGVLAARSTHARVPGHGVIPLAKFASMGSALCFPFEAMVFLTIVLVGIQQANNIKLSLEDIESLSGKVRIYGDDIIVPREYARVVQTVLEEFGLVVNRDKSFWNGKFRESCGGDYFAGVDATPVRPTAPLPLSHDDASGVAAWVAFRNHAFLRGLERTSAALDRELERALNGHYPIVGPNSPVLGRLSHSGSVPERFDKRTHALQVRGYVVRPVKRRNPLDDVGALMKYFLNADDLPVVDKEHLEYSGRPVAVTLKLRWAPAD
jgi:hypothetical protein